jgi:DNA-binding winged helix-turn-helix (wHTH) protein/TolB-like protein/Tfp pilus assembly protein PilF
MRQSARFPTDCNEPLPPRPAAGDSQVAGFSFGQFTLDLRRHALLRGRSEIKLRPKTFDVLVYLVGAAGRLVSKQDLIEAVWRDVAVTDDSLVQCLVEIRRALGDAEAVRTVRGRGYVFDVDVHPVLAHGRQPPALSPPGHANSPVVGDALVDGPRATTRLGRHAGLLWLGIAALMVVTLGSAAYVWKNRPADRSPIDRGIAVLPFKPLVPDQQDEGLQLGLAESLITRLSRLPGLRVRPIGVVRAYAVADLDPVSAGGALGVGAVLEGSIQRAGGTLRVSVRLLRVADGQQLWTEEFREPAEHILQVQSAIAERVATALALRLTQGERTGIAEPETRSSDAYYAYLEGRIAHLRRTRDGVRTAVTRHETAISIDPGFALAHAGLARALTTLGVLGSEPPERVYPRAANAARRAIELDPTLADAYVALGHVQAQYDWDWAGAEESYRRALALDPGLADAHVLLAILLASQDRAGESVALIEEGRQLDPLLPWPFLEGLCRLWAREHETAARLLASAVAANPSDTMAQFWLAHTHVELGRLDDALAAALGSRAEVGNAPTWLVGYIHARAGRFAEADRVEQALREQSKTVYVPATEFALLSIARGRHDEALDWLERGLAERSRWMDILGVHPFFDPLRDDPRFQAIAQRVLSPTR